MRKQQSGTHRNCRLSCRSAQPGTLACCYAHSMVIRGNMKAVPRWLRVGAELENRVPHSKLAGVSEKGLTFMKTVGTTT